MRSKRYKRNDVLIYNTTSVLAAFSKYPVLRKYRITRFDEKSGNYYIRPTYPTYPLINSISPTNESYAYNQPYLDGLKFINKSN